MVWKFYAYSKVRYLVKVKSLRKINSKKSNYGEKLKKVFSSAKI